MLFRSIGALLSSDFALDFPTELKIQVNRELLLIGHC